MFTPPVDDEMMNGFSESQSKNRYYFSTFLDLSCLNDIEFLIFFAV